MLAKLHFYSIWGYLVYTVYAECTFACYHAIFIRDYFHICIRLMECEINEMKKKKNEMKSADWFRSHWTNGREKVEIKSTNAALKSILLRGYTETWTSQRVNSRALIVHNMHWPSPDNKICIKRTDIIC